MTADDEIRRGWRLIFASSVGVICSSIVLPYYSIGALVVPVTTEFGWSRAQFQTAILFSSGLGALTAPVVGWLIDRYGARRIALPGLVGLAAGFFIAASMSGPLWMLYLAYGAMALLGAGTIPVSWTRAIATNFFNRRGLALGLTLSGTGVCAMAAPHYTVWLESNFGWRAAYLGLGLLPILLAGPIVFFFFKPVERRGGDDAVNGQELTGYSLGEAARQYRFWVLLLSILAAYMGFSGIGTNLFPSLTDDGLSARDAATVQSVFGGAIIVGRIVVGYLVDKFWAPGIAGVSMVMPFIGATIFAGSPGLEWAILAGFLIGFAAGAELDLMSFLAARYFGLRHYAKIYAILYAALAICSGTAPMLFARVHDATESYDLSFRASSVLFLIGAALVLSLGRYPARFASER
ncbi:MAG: MFS transporter [Caulobacterales bacterium]|nr:MFS transporter [Caulobacterales bacterium]